MMEKLQGYKVILGSKSPRRQQLLEQLGLKFEVRTREIDESFGPGLKREEIPVYIARQKAQAFVDELQENELLITSDTIVWIKDKVLGKPSTKEEAFQMLREISGEKHIVYTGVCLRTAFKEYTFFEATEVAFHHLTDEEIEFYLDRYQPFDKAGAYGIQEYIGLIGIKAILGDFYNVMGFPVQKFWRELDNII